MSSDLIKNAIHVTAHHAKHKFLHSAREHPLGTGIGVVAGVGLAVVAAPVVAASAAATATAAAVAAVGCGILGGEAEKVIKKH